MLWLHPEQLPLGLVSVGDTEREIVKVPKEARNRYGRIVPVIAIAAKAFSGNGRITDIFLPPSLEWLPAGAFAGCGSLRSIALPKKLKRIPEGTFRGCVNLKDIYYEGTPEEWAKIDIVHQKHEIKFGAPIPGTPVQSVDSEAYRNIPGNEAIFSVNIHFGCALE